MQTLEQLELASQKEGICLSYLHFRFKCTANAGTILQRCLSQVCHFREKLGKQLCVYKLGLTSNPALRFQFYKEGNYTHMTVLHVSCNLGLIQMLEAALIAANISEKGCRNQRYGGEGPPGSIEEPYHFAYVVGARADSFKRIRWSNTFCNSGNSFAPSCLVTVLLPRGQKAGQLEVFLSTKFASGFIHIPHYFSLQQRSRSII